MQPPDKRNLSALKFSWRDQVVCAICNWLLNHVASPDYRAMIGGSIRLGLKTAAERPFPTSATKPVTVKR